ncbi:MAG: GHMP kinase [Candidatus Sumerlaeia bacterium]
MQIIETRAYARAGLVGNPSDGYYGKTISFTFSDFSARVVIYDWPTLEILPCEQDKDSFENLCELVEDVKRNGYYGGLRLIKASIKKFWDYCAAAGITLPERNFTIRYETSIPRQVGLAGSSSIITATFRALMAFYGVKIPAEIMPNWVLATEVEEIGIHAGLQDRVAQCYDGLVYMDFAKDLLERDKHGRYEPLDISLLPNLYIAYQVVLAEVSDVVHSNLRERWARGDKDVVDAMKGFAELAERGRAALLAGNHAEFARIMDANFDLRRSIIPISAANIKMVETARACGASAKFAGSGGAIVGVYPDEAAYEKLTRELTAIGCRVIKPKLTAGRVKPAKPGDAVARA